jgi:hypothetical protein
MPNGTARRDLQWLRLILRTHFTHAWRQVFAKLETQQAKVAPSDASAQRRERTTSATAL